MIVIVDYDMGNPASIKNMLHKSGCDDVIISQDKKDLENAEKIILPGVGSFDQGVRNLTELGLFQAIKTEVINNKKSILGICLGMQMLGGKSEEGKCEGLGILPLNSVKFNLPEQYKIPHMGWDTVKIKKKDPLLGLTDSNEQRFYFVHSYHAVCDDSSDILMTSEYGYDFCAAVSRDNIYGVQFHPEKSHRYGMELLKNYVRM